MRKAPYMVHRVLNKGACNERGRKIADNPCGIQSYTRVRSSTLYCIDARKRVVADTGAIGVFCEQWYFFSTWD